MGIRYDRDTRRATNGPVIFFSDASSAASLNEEIESAILSGLSFYSYCEPGSPMISFGSSEGFEYGVSKPGFIIGMFDPSSPIITIPYKGCKADPGLKSCYSQPLESTSYETYCKEVEDFIAIIKETEKGKIVASRVLLRENRTSPGELFFDLSTRFPDCFIFCFSTPATGCWIGASPEILIKSNNGILTTMALAGTKENNEKVSWDEKNIEEQEIVKDYILDSFRKAGMIPEAGDTYSRNVGKISHLCTPVSAAIPVSDNFSLEKFLKDLSPTPALCGFPKDLALKAILNVENFERGCYGGFCGPYHSLNDFSLNVVLRCASLSERKICLYAGGGITAKSNPHSEWVETENKLENTFGGIIS